MPAPQVSVAKPVVKTITEYDEYTGRFEAVHRVELQARISGILLEQHFSDGEMVEKGDLLFTIDPALFEVAVESAEAEVERAEAQVEYAKGDFERAQSLPSGVATQRDIAQRQASLKAAEAELELARANLKQAELSLSYTKVTAPVAGRTSKALTQPGNFVQGGAQGGTQLVTILSVDPIRFVFEASETNYLRYIRLSEAGRRSSGQADHKVFLQLSDEQEFIHEGKMEFVDNEIGATTGTIRGRAVFANDDLLFSPGMFARMRLPSTAAYEATLVADQAIQAQGQGRFVYIVNAEGAVEPRPVEPGGLHAGLRIIRSGLQGGERVVLTGLQMLRPGMPVEASEVPMPGSLAPTKTAEKTR